MTDRNDDVQQAPAQGFEPYEEHNPVPLPVLWIAVALALWGAFMLFNSGRGDQAGQEERVEQFVPDADTEPARAGADVGAALFQANCSTCHQPNAVGVRNAIPPLAGSPFVAARPEVMVQILLHGIDGPIQVGPNIYDGHMPDFSGVLDDEQIASIVGYVRGTWGPGDEDATTVDADFVAAQRERFPDRGAWRGGAELAEVVDPSLPPQPPARLAGTADLDPAVRQLVEEGRGAAWSCASCHGESGQGQLNVPRLAGLPAAYITKQLQDYVDGTRRNENMEVVAKALTAEEMEKLGEYYAGVRAPSNAQPRLGGDLERGETLALQGDWSKDIPSCFSCHGPSGVGVEPEFPALAAQHPEYTVLQLAGWVAGRRDNASVDLMDHIAQALDHDDRRAVADYLATLPPVPASFGGTSLTAGEEQAGDGDAGNPPGAGTSAFAGEPHVQD